MSLDILGFSHVGFAVRSIEEFQATWGRSLGLTEWTVHEEQAPGGIQLHGSDTGPLVVRVAFARLAGTSLELIETREGMTHHREHLERTASGLHHIAFWVRDLSTELAKVGELGLEIVMSPASLRPELRDRPVSAVVKEASASGSIEIPQFFAFLDTLEGDKHFTLELLDAKFADDYRKLNGRLPYYPGELTT